MKDDSTSRNGLSRSCPGRAVPVTESLTVDSTSLAIGSNFT